MQIPLKRGGRNQSAWALTIVLAFLLASLLVFAGLMYWVSGNSKLTQRNNQFLASEYAAEAATEVVLSQMDRDFLSQSLTNASFYATLPIPQTGWPVTYVFSDTNGVANQVSVNIGVVPAVAQPLNSQYAGLYGFAQDCLITATATPTNLPYNVPATVSQDVQFASIPIFQFAIFYNINLEIDPGAAMNVRGPVFSNAGIWGGTSRLTFSSEVSAVGQVNVTSTDPFCSGKVDASAPPVFSLAGQPISGANALTLPIGTGGTSTNTSATNVEAILNLPPAAYAMGTAAGYSTNGLVYNFNACDLIISNSFNGTNGFLGTNLTLTFQDPSSSIYLNQLTNNEVCTFSNRTTHLLYTTNSPVSLLPATNYVCVASGFSFVTNVVFWDYREGKNVQAVQIDVGKFNSWLTNPNFAGSNWNAQCALSNHKNHTIDSICIFNSVPLTGSTLPAVRVINGQQLYDWHGLTVSTPQPLYVLGDYNTTTNGTVFSKTLGNTVNTRPAGLMGDSITILSGNWNDATYTSGYALGSRTAAATCINAAALEGIVQSTNSNYSGGVENFLRLLESWGTTLTYNGSIVVLFPSIYATNYWITPGTYYNAPTRNWGFDVKFNQQVNLPPMTPQSKAVIRSQWTGF